MGKLNVFQMVVHKPLASQFVDLVSPPSFTSTSTPLILRSQENKPPINS